jgi:hypothetical protein
MQIAASILTQAEQARLQVQAAATAATRAPAATTSEYKQQAEPLAALFQQLVKHVERGDAPVDDGEAMFDPVAGKTLIPFAKSTKLTSWENLIYLVHLLIVFWTSVMKRRRRSTSAS